MSNPVFPDYSNQEEIIDTYNDAEFLYKAGKRICRYKMKTVGEDNNNYDFIKPYMKGKVLNVGLGMGLSVDKILETSATKIVTYEIESDIAELYKRHKTDLKLTIESKDAFTNKPIEKFDIILMEIFVTSDNLQNVKDYLTWAFKNILKDGCIIVPCDRYYSQLMNDYTSKLEYIYNKPVRQMGREKIWIICKI